MITQPHTHCQRERCALEPADGTRARRPSRAASSSSTSCFQTGIISGGTGGTNRGQHQDHWQHQLPPARSPGVTPSKGLWCDPTEIPTTGLLQVPAAWCSLQSFLGFYWAEALLQISFFIFGELLALGCHGLLEPVAPSIAPSHGPDTITLQHSTGTSTGDGINPYLIEITPNCLYQGKDIEMHSQGRCSSGP